MNSTNKGRWTAVVAVALATVSSLGIATARAVPPTDPPTDPPAGASCVYTLSAPSMISVSGTKTVTATLKPGPCTGEINMNSLTVCVELLGDTRPQCARHATFDPVQVYFTPYRPGASYRSTGRGCGNTFPNGDEACSSLGPYTATL